MTDKVFIKYTKAGPKFKDKAMIKWSPKNRKSSGPVFVDSPIPDSEKRRFTWG